MSILIQNGTLILPQGPVRASLRVEGTRIAEIGPDLPAGSSRVLDASGKLVFPGFIDTHTHFEMNKGTPRETADNWFSGTRAALAGGTTCVLDFAEPERGCSLQSALEEWHRRADGRACCHYGFHMTIKDWDPRIRAELPAMTAQGVTSYKIYLAYDPLRVSDAVAFSVIEAVGREGGVLGCHCENGDLIQCAVARQGPDQGCCSAEIGIFSPGGARLWGRTVPDVQKVTALFSAAYNHRKVDVFDFRETEV